jgi:signal transduction histidine kinase
MARLGRVPARIAGWLFPTRASTQTWMMLTFALFIGVAVASVGLYLSVEVRSELRTTVEQMLRRQVVLTAESLERADGDAGLVEEAIAIARVTEDRITVLRGDSVLVDVQRTRLLSDGGILARKEIAGLGEGSFGFAERVEGGVRTYFAAVHRPASGLVVRLGMPESALVLLVHQLQVIIAAAMLLVFLLSVVAAWIAARRVTEPLEAIRRSARHIAGGQLERDIVVESRAAEFQDLAASLNRMSDTFKDRIGDLQRLAALQNEFIGNVSHEVRNPIFAVGGYLEALASSALSADQRRFYAEKGLANLERLNNLFNDLIEIARLEYREDMIKTVDFDLHELVEEVADMLRSKAGDKGLELVTDNPVVWTHADRNRIRQVLVNLIDNAIAYSDEGIVRCRYRRHLDKVRIEVVDTGRGIPEEHLERIFERFYRVDPDRSRKSGGTGLGLSIVKQILHAHGEVIHVESTVGRSTRFWFELPLVQPTPEA